MRRSFSDALSCLTTSMLSPLIESSGKVQNDLAQDSRAALGGIDSSARRDALPAKLPLPLNVHRALSLYPQNHRLIADCNFGTSLIARREAHGECAIGTSFESRQAHDSVAPEEHPQSRNRPRTSGETVSASAVGN